jgi:hypothetical protein
MMRVGVTRHTVYVAPKQRAGRGGPGRGRPNLAGLLMDRAMLPALKTNAPRIELGLRSMLNEVGRDWERA